MSDFDDLTTTGFYSVEGTHSPSGSSSVWYSVLVMRIAGNAAFVTQLAMATGTNSGAWLRTMDGGTWGSWAKL